MMKENEKDNNTTRRMVNAMKACNELRMSPVWTGKGVETVRGMVKKGRH